MQGKYIATEIRRYVTGMPAGGEWFPLVDFATDALDRCRGGGSRASAAISVCSFAANQGKRKDVKPKPASASHAKSAPNA